MEKKSSCAAAVRDDRLLNMRVTFYRCNKNKEYKKIFPKCCASPYAEAIRRD